MEFDWYNIINYDDFIDLGLPSTTVQVILEGIGLVDILVTKGIGVSLKYDDVFLMVNLNSNNPFAFDGHAVYIDADNDIWLGIEVE
jgi:hypothetical protein